MLTSSSPSDLQREGEKKLMLGCEEEQVDGSEEQKKKELKPSYASVLKSNNNKPAIPLSKTLPQPQPQPKPKPKLQPEPKPEPEPEPEPETVIDISDLLFTTKRNYLIKPNNNKVGLENLVGKFVCIYFIPLSRYADEDDIEHSSNLVIDMYDQLEKTNKGCFEVVVVETGDGPRFMYNYMVPKKMPFAAVLPFADYEARIRACDKFKVSFYDNKTNHFVLDPNGNIIDDMIFMFGTFGAEIYPFTWERITDVMRQDDEIITTGITSLETLLGDFVISNSAVKVPTHKLKHKTVALFIYSESIAKEHDQFVEKLKQVYEKYKEDDFEVVLVHNYFCTDGYRSKQTFWKIFKSMPWLALPFKHPNCIKLWRIFQDNIMSHSSLLEPPFLIIVYPDGSLNIHGAHILDKYGLGAYPFSWERVADMEVARLHKLKLDVLMTNPGYLLRKNHKFQVSELFGKRVLFLFSDLFSEENLFLLTLKNSYYNAKDTENEFEVVYFPTCRNNRRQYEEGVVDSPWLVHPFGTSIANMFVRQFFKLYYRDMVGLVAFERDGHIVAKELINNLNDVEKVMEREKRGFMFILEDLWSETLSEFERAHDNGM